MVDRGEHARHRRFGPYPAYKDSGVEWLGEIPEDWKVKKLSWLTKCLDRQRIPLNAEERGRMQGDYPYIGANSILDYVDQWLFDEELVLLGEDGAPFFDKSRPVAFRITGKTWVNNHAHVLRPQGTIDAKFLAHALNCVDYRAFIDGSTRDKLTQGDMSGIPVQCPKVKEQRAIADFLDHETAKIDGLVARKERLIELLQEKRTALITHAVTRGLDPNVPMKDSGVEWLGDIPAHWEPARLWRLCSATSGATPTKENPAYWNGEIPWISPKDMKRRVISTSEDLITQQALNETGIKLVTPEVVLVVVRGMILAHSFPVAVTASPVTINQDMKALRLIDGVEAFYFAWALDGLARGIVATVVEEAAHGTRVIRMDQWRSLVVPLPPHPEQAAIASFLECETTNIDALIAKVRQAIDRLKEFRTALVSAAVTGKIDVRATSAKATAGHGGTR